MAVLSTKLEDLGRTAPKAVVERNPSALGGSHPLPFGRRRDLRSEKSTKSDKSESEEFSSHASRGVQPSCRPKS